MRKKGGRACESTPSCTLLERGRFLHHWKHVVEGQSAKSGACVGPRLANLKHSTEALHAAEMPRPVKRLPQIRGARRRRLRWLCGAWSEACLISGFLSAELDIGCFGGLPMFLQSHWCGGLFLRGFRRVSLAQHVRRLLKVTVGILGPTLGRRGQQNY